MTDTLDRRPFALAGLLSLVLALGGTLVLSDAPQFVDDPATIAAYYEAELATVLMGHTLYLLSAVLLLWFAGGLYATLRAAERPGGYTAILALAGAAATLRTAPLPRWLGLISIPLGVALLIPPINHIAIVAFRFWVGVAAIALLVAGAPARGTPPMPA